MSKLYGWWSAQAARQTGYSIYKTPEGVRINVTHVTHDPQSHGTCWPDIRFKGEVTEHCRNISAPEDYLEEEYVEKPLVPHDSYKLHDFSSRFNLPCPLKYYGTGQCTCGDCPIHMRVRKVNTNPFGY